MVHAQVANVKGISRTRSLAFVGLTIAIMAVSAWVTIPIGPVPFTLQMFALTFAIVVLSPKECVASAAGYLALGAVGLPVFSGMRGGIGVLAGPTGGFLWGYLFGAAAGSLLLWVVRTRMANRVESYGQQSAKKRSGNRILFCVELVAGVLFTGVSYLCGWAQFMAVMGVSAQAAFAVAIAPFIVVDAIKIVAAVVCARAVRAAVK